MVVRVISIALGMGLVGCQTTGQTSAAVLEQADEGTINRVKAVLADAMQKTSVDIGPVDLTITSVIPVLPPSLGPLEGNSPATPILFDLMITGQQCFVVRRETGDAFRLDGVDCRAAD